MEISLFCAVDFQWYAVLLIFIHYEHGARRLGPKVNNLLQWWLVFGGGCVVGQDT